MCLCLPVWRCGVVPHGMSVLFILKPLVWDGPVRSRFSCGTQEVYILHMEGASLCPLWYSLSVTTNKEYTCVVGRSVVYAAQ